MSLNSAEINPCQLLKALIYLRVGHCPPSPMSVTFKFEFIEGKPLINSTPGTRNVLAMLPMTGCDD